MKGFAFGFDDTCIKAYDPDTKTLIDTFDTFTKAGAKFGVSGRVVSEGCYTKKKKYSPVYKKEIAFRLAKKEK